MDKVGTGMPGLVRRVSMDSAVLAGFVVLLLLGAIWAVALYVIDAERDNAEHDAAETCRELAEVYVAQMARSLAAIEQALRIVKFAHERQRHAVADAFADLRERGLMPPAVVFAIAIADRSGNIVAATRPREWETVTRQPYFLTHVEKDTDTTFVGRAIRNTLTGGWEIRFSRRLNAADGSFDGVVVLAVDPAYFTSGYERSRLGDHGVLGLLREEGQFLVWRSGELVSYGSETGDRAFAQTEVPGKAAVLLTHPWDGTPRYTSIRRLRGVPLTAIVGLSREETLEPFQRQRRAYLWQAAAASAVLIVISIVLGLSYWQVAKSRRRMRKLQETYYAASDASLDGYFLLKPVAGLAGTIADFVFDDMNGRAEALIGAKKGFLLGRTLCEVFPESRDDGVLEELVDVVESGKVREREWQNRLPNVQAEWLYRQVVKVEDGVVVIVHDITERKRTEERIRHMANHDVLTGLPNRSLLDDRLKQAMLQAQRYRRLVMVAFVDLDNFKLINDSMGHHIGDELLKVVAARMVECVRRTDTVARLGGDEFVVVLSEQQDLVDAVTPTLQKIRAAIAQPVEIGDKKIQVTCSMGVTIYPDDGVDTHSLLMNADAAMYRAKESGHNNCQFYTAELNARIHEKLELQEGLRTALAEGKFLLHYQPQVDLHTGRVLGVEALVRWRRPGAGLVSPARFIPMAEENGLIVPIGEWVLRTACRQNKAWQDSGLEPFTVAVNLSARQFREGSLVCTVEAALQESGLAPRWLELELTESLIMQDVQKAVSTMRELREMGVQLSIDDFGTGYSSLSALKSFPIARLKLDQSFVRDLPHDEEDKAIATAVISLGHMLQLRVIAEGVENAQQLTFLRDNGCDEMQGYYFSKPVPPEGIVELLRPVSAVGTVQMPLH